MKKKFRDINIILYVFQFLWTKQEKNRSLFFISFCLILLTICFNISVPLVLKEAVYELSSLDDSGISYKLALLLAAYVIIWTLSQVSEHVKQIVMIRPLAKGIRFFSHDLFEHLHSLPMQFHLDRKTGAITSALECARQGIPDVFWSLFLLFIPTIMELFLATLILTYYYGLKYGLVLLLIVGVFIVFTLYSTEKSSHYQALSNIQQSHANSLIVDSLLNFASVKYFNNQKYEVLRCVGELKKSEKLLIKMRSNMESVRIGQRIIIGIGLTLLTFMAAKQALTSGFGVEDFVLVNGYILQFAAPLRLIGLAARDFRRGINALREVMEILETKTTSLVANSKDNMISEFESIEFRNVSFGYDPSLNILNNMSFCLKVGQSVGIVGTTGSGKSTIANLIFGFFNSYSGEIFINNKNLQTIETNSLYNLLGIIPQDITLFNASIYENILFARPTASKKEVEEVMALSCLESFLKKLPNHYNTIVGERGLKLSGGEKQRIAIARVLLKKPSLYIFDEATSSLDPSTENTIMNNIMPTLKNSTSLIIAHRLSTVVKTNEILVLENGIIKERGTHPTLLKNRGIYTSMWNADNSSS